MNEQITQQEFEEVSHKMRELFQEAEIKVLATFPMWMRFNYIGNKINKLLQDGHTEDEIDWDKVNYLLSNNRDEYDFNDYDKIKTVDQFLDARELCFEGQILIGPWQLRVCKDCGKKFTMQFSEVEFYRKKKLHLPKRCPECRARRKEKAKNEQM